MSTPSRKSSDSEGWWTREHSLIAVLLAVTAVVIYLCFRLAQPFLPALAGALAMAVMVRPLHTWIERQVGSSNLAAAISVAVVTAVLIVPTLFIVRHLAHEAAQGADQLQTKALDGNWRQTVANYPRLAAALDWLETHVDVQGETRTLVSGFLGELSALVGGSVRAALMLVITLFTLYFFLRDRRQMLAWARSLTPLSDRETADLFRRVADTIHATVYGTLVVALAQGALGGLIFWLLGLPSPVFWGVVMALLAVVPWLGAFVIWLPAAAFLALAGELSRALILIAWGTFVVGLIDNLLYPLLVGQRMRLHPLPVFFAIVGGLLVFGGAGVILGPVVLACANALVPVWRNRTRGGQYAEVALAAKSS